ncbi:MAG: hypothetical protein ACREMA_19555, partial [Longimicrobiales bacterium]
MKVKVFFALLLLAVASTQASAQLIWWDAPSYFSPKPMDDIGLYVSRSTSVDEATGLSGIWRQSGNVNLGVRAGIGDLNDAGGTVLVGAELYGPLNSLLPGTAVDISWILGAGAVFGSRHTLFSVPVGASFGLQLGSGGVQILPYVYPRVSLDITAVEFNGREETDMQAGFAVDLGADVSLGERFILRVGGSLIDREAFGVG